MKDFEGKRLRLTYQSGQGSVAETGSFVRLEDPFLIIISHFTNKIKYVNLAAVKTVEILGEANDER
jgi:hypothetical protein